MIKFNISVFILTVHLLLLSFIYNSLTPAQTKITKYAISILDSTKFYYGDTCEVGISSPLIIILKKYKNIPAIKEYLNQYDSIRNKIIKFRSDYSSLIKNEPALLLDLSRILSPRKQQNIANACGIYFGPDSVNNLILSYSILRSSVDNFYIGVIQIANLDQVFKVELEQPKTAWYQSKILYRILHKNKNNNK